MKKIKILLISLLLFIPISVLADAGPPTSTYKIRVSNPNGANVYSTSDLETVEKVLPYDTILTVMYEEYHGKEMYLNAFYDTGKLDEDGEKILENYELKKEDITPLKIDLKDYSKIGNTKIYSFDTDNYLYEGPSKIYKKIEPEKALEKNKTYKVLYEDGLWAYVTVNDISGWVYTADSERYEDYSPTGNPANLATYNETYGRQNIITIKDESLYESPKSTTKTGITIPKNTELEGTYYYDGVYYVKYNNSSGWIKPEFNKDAPDKDMIINFAYKCQEEREYEDCEIKTNKNQSLYDDFNSKKVIKEIEPATLKYDYYIRESSGKVIEWYHINDDKIKGWIYINFDDQLEEDDDEDNDIIIPNPSSSSSSDSIISSSSSSSKIDKEYNETKELVLYIIIGVLLLSLTALVTVMLINKKKQTTNDN